MKIIFARFLGSHSGGYEVSYVLGYRAMYSQPTLLNNTLLPTLESKCKPSKKPAGSELLCLPLAPFWAYFSTLKMEAILSSEASIDARSTQRHTTEDIL